MIAWRHSGVIRMAYLECTVAAPFSPLPPGFEIDKLAGPDAQVLICAGYRRIPPGTWKAFASTTFGNAAFACKANTGATTQFTNLR